MIQRENQYRFILWRTRAAQVVIGLGAVLILGGSLGCKGFADQQRVPDQESARQEGATMARELYASMVEVFEAETEGVDLRIEERLTVVSRYEDLPNDRRRRFVGRVVPVGRGGMGVNISAHYQQAIGEDEDGVLWEEVPAEDVAEEASALELSLARKIERQFHQRRR